jgi:methionine synthase II (cobalamin-independent)
MAASQLANGSTIGIGSLPFRDLGRAIEFALGATVIPTIPTLPKRSPAEGMVVQSVLGIEGITVGQYGAISVDVSRLDPLHPVVTDLQHDAFGGFRAFLAAAAGLDVVKWQMVGPVTLGKALLRAGVPDDLAFDVSVRAVRAHLQHLLDVVNEALPACTQVVFIDEPDMADVTDVSFPLAPDTAIDLVSGALAAVESRAVSGLHVCGDADWSSLISAGPRIMSIPVDDSVLGSAGYLQQFLARGGIIAWGAVHTDGPIATSVERPWRRLSELWCQLVERGCDHVLLRQQCLISPECGLGMHTPSVVERVHRIATELGRRVNDQATASRFVLGA